MRWVGLKGGAQLSDFLFLGEEDLWGEFLLEDVLFLRVFHDVSMYIVTTFDEIKQERIHAEFCLTPFHLWFSQFCFFFARLASIVPRAKHGFETVQHFDSFSAAIRAAGSG